jgi:hypothetical protein
VGWGGITDKPKKVRRRQLQEGICGVSFFFFFFFFFFTWYIESVQLQGTHRQYQRGLSRQNWLLYKLVLDTHSSRKNITVPFDKKFRSFFFFLTKIFFLGPICEYSAYYIIFLFSKRKIKETKKNRQNFRDRDGIGILGGWIKLKNTSN